MVNFRYVALLGAFCASPAFAATTILQASGIVTDIRALQNSLPASTPSGIISIGDIYNLSVSFDLANATLSSVFDADPTVNIYHLPGSMVTLNVGGYSTSYSPIFDFNSSVQLWNDRAVGGLVDAQSFSFFRFQAPQGELPFEMGPGSASYSSDFYAFDFTAQARNNDLISQLISLDQFGSKSFSLGFLNADTNLFVHVTGSINSAQLISSAVPEPATWATMLLGFGLIGGAMRRRQKARAGDKTAFHRSFTVPA